MLKKIIAGLVLNVAILIGACVVGANAESIHSVGIKQSHGFEVLAQNEAKDDSTIVGQVLSTTGKYAEVQNVYDAKDIIYVDKKALHKYEIVRVTFHHDDVIKVVKNDWNIGKIVFGQKIIVKHTAPVNYLSKLDDSKVVKGKIVALSADLDHFTLDCNGTLVKGTGEIVDGFIMDKGEDMWVEYGKNGKIKQIDSYDPIAFAKSHK